MYTRGSAIKRTDACDHLGSTLRPLSATYRAKVRAAYRGPTRLDDAARRLLADAIFKVMAELEQRQPKHEQVAILRAVRNVLLDDLGENEAAPGLRWPAVETAEAIIRRRAKRGFALGPGAPAGREAQS
ncbi:MAG: hypothetical protein HY744_13680 [Deltaproteobacteria bacterium]|nr:hypothetical protein [Deltaproteobacteria bacterium]